MVRPPCLLRNSGLAWSGYMWIKSFRVLNYKSFEDSGVHTLSRNMNVVVGQNNVGKTALLQALAQRIDHQPHKNSKQRQGAPLNRISRTDFDFEATSQELKDAIM